MKTKIFWVSVGINSLEILLNGVKLLI